MHFREDISSLSFGVLGIGSLREMGKNTKKIESLGGRSFVLADVKTYPIDVVNAAVLGTVDSHTAAINRVARGKAISPSTLDAWWFPILFSGLYFLSILWFS